jgi:hypothetical protein
MGWPIGSIPFFVRFWCIVGIYFHHAIWYKNIRSDIFLLFVVGLYAGTGKSRNKHGKIKFFCVVFAIERFVMYYSFFNLTDSCTYNKYLAVF